MSDNPPAFPQQCADALGVGMVHEGMLLRDYFAGQALSALMTMSMTDTEGYALPIIEREPARARAAYRMADLMLAERQKEPSK
jgi:hypothetical protein